MITLESPSITHVFLFGGDSRAAAIGQLEQVQRQLRAQPRVPLADLATGCLRAHGRPRLAIVAATHQLLDELLARAAKRLEDPTCRRIQDAAGIYFTESPLYASGRLAFLFPGEGAPFPGMLAGLRDRFPVLEPMLAKCEMIETGMRLPAGSLLDCLTSSDQDQHAALERQLHDFNFSLAVNVWCSWCLHLLLHRLGVGPHAIAGHSAGEATALYAARAVTDESPYALVQQIAQLQQLDTPPSGMLAVGAGYARVERLLTDAGLAPGDASNIFMAMDNCPHQVVLVGTEQATERAESVLRQTNLIVQRLDLPRPYHTKLFRPYLPALSGLMASLEFQAPEIPIYSCATARKFPQDPAEILDLAVQQWVQPVRFTELIQNMYQDGVRIFVEVGPRANLSAFVEDILRGSPVLAAPTNRAGRSAEAQVTHLIAQLAIHHVPLDLNYVYPSEFRSETSELSRAASAELVPSEFAAPAATESTQTPPETSTPPASSTTTRSTATTVIENATAIATTSTNPESTSVATSIETAGTTWATTSTAMPTNLPSGAPVPALTISRPLATSRPARGRIRQTVSRVSHSRRAASETRLTTQQHVLLGHQQLMRQFLQTQQDVMRQYLTGQGAPPSVTPATSAVPVTPIAVTPSATPVVATTRDEPRFVAPLFAQGEVVAMVPGQSLTLRRSLDLEEDLYADQHTLGGQKNSRVDPSQHGQPLMPMTFFLEMVAQTARQLFPSLCVTHIRRVHLMKWLPFYANDPGATEVRMRRIATPDESPDSPIVMHAEVWDLGASKRAATLGEGGLAARCEVVLGSTYASGDLAHVQFDHPRPCPTTVEKLYNNLFHGPAFQGVSAVGRMGDQQIECEVEVQPRAELFRSTPSPDFVLDPVTLDIVMHPLAVWHLADPDQTGRIMLPFQLEELEMFGPAPNVGDRFLVEGWVEHSSARRYAHSLIAFRKNGQAWCRMRLARFWRFYLPFHNVNFHGPKDIYYLSDDRHELFPSLGQRASLVQLDVPEDLTNASLRTAGLQVVFSPREQRIFESLNLPSTEVSAWLFSRFAVKDAARRFRLAMDGQTMFAADLEVEQIADGWFRTVARDGYDDTPLPHVAIRCVDGVYFAAGAIVERLGFDCRSWQSEFAEPDAAAAQLARHFADQTGTPMELAIQQVTSMLQCLRDLHGGLHDAVWQDFAHDGQPYRCRVGQVQYDIWSTIHDNTIISLGLPALPHP